jgi:hypothetical protein
MTRTELAKRLDELLAERVAERSRIEIERAINKEREDIVACIRAGSWSGTEEIVAMIRNRAGWRQPDMFPKGG